MEGEMGDRAALLILSRNLVGAGCVTHAVFTMGDLQWQWGGGGGAGGWTRECICRLLFRVSLNRGEVVMVVAKLGSGRVCRCR